MIRVPRWVTAAVLGGAVLPLSACNRYSAGTTGNAQTVEKPPVEIGAPLYKAEAMPKPQPFSPAPEPVVIPNAIVQNDLKVQIAAQVDGKVEMIATPLAPGESCPPDLLVYHPRDPEKRPYRRLRAGDLIREGQLIARLDEQLVTLQRQAAEKSLPLQREAVLANRKSEADYQQSYDQMEKTNANALSLVERLEKRSTLFRYIEARLKSEQELAKTESELAAAMAQQARYFVYSPFNGRIARVLKSRDEYARAGESIMEVTATERVRVEGKLDAAYRNLVRPGMKVTVEPARPISPHPMSVSHRLEVTGLAVTAHPGRPMVVSGGLDGSVLIWDLTGTKQFFRLPMPAGVAVRSVACTGKGSKAHLVAAGGDDGKVRVWDVSNPDKLPTQPPAAFADAHAAAVTAVGFSPDGRHLATAAGRDVYVWDVAAKARKYALPAEHKDAVTAVRFTPQCTLLTAARDRSLRVWKLGEQGAATQTVIDHRNGSVDQLGVSSDGGRVLFDKDPGRLDVVSLADERTVGALSAPGGSARFATVALFSPDDSFVLTAGGESDQRGELTLWEAPQPGGRGAERLRLTTPRGATVTCAAFSPDPDKRFVVVGTADGGVHYWTPSLADQRSKTLTAEVVSVLPHDARQVLVGVELANPSAVGDDLPDRSQATIIISADGQAPQAAAPPATVRPAAATGSEAGGVVPAGLVVPPAAAPGAALPPANPGGGPVIPPAVLPPANK
jgi:WD40 repeat protein